MSLIDDIKFDRVNTLENKFKKLNKKRKNITKKFNKWNKKRKRGKK